MKKIFSLFLFVLISAFVLAQTTYTTAQTGFWNANSTWVGGSPPQLLGDNIVIIDQNHKLQLILESFSQMEVLPSNPMQNFYILTEILVFFHLELLI
jgi:hypothetical protein